MGFISSHHAQILHNNSLINLHTLEAARQNGVQRYLYTSSACVYPEYRQTETDVAAAEGGGRVPGRPAGRLRLGEAHHRAALPALHRGLRHRDAHRPLPQHLRPARHLGRRPREGAGGAVPQDRDREAERQPVRSRCGATASRRAPSATSTTASRALSHHALRLSRAAQPRSGPHDQHQRPGAAARRHRGLRGRARARRPGRRASAAATRDNTRLREVLGWEPAISLEDGLDITYRWIEAQVREGMEQGSPSLVRTGGAAAG